MSITSYAQNFEDVMLWRALGHIKQGFYIDIGAQDPLIDSVSLAFHEHGWKGIHVEPTAHYAELLRRNRPGDTVIQAAVGGESSILRFFEIQETGISTADENIAAQHRESGFDVQEITVPCVTLSEIFNICADQQIHWLKIDVEGFEKQVLASWGTSAARPWILVIESTLPLTQVQTHGDWEQLVVSRDYSPVYFDGLNRYYVSNAHPELNSAFDYPPNVFDRFSLNGTASATFHHLIKKRYQQENEESLSKIIEQKLSSEQAVETLNKSLVNSESIYKEQVSRAKQTIEDLLRHQAQREQDTLALQRTLQKMAEDRLESAFDKGQLEREFYERHAQREKEVTNQIILGQQEFQRQLESQVRREQVLSKKTSDAVLALEKLLRDQLKREQDLGVYMLDLEERTARDTVEQLHQHHEHERRLQSEYAEKEREYVQQIVKAQLECERLLRHQLHREEQFSAQLLIKQQEFLARQDFYQNELLRLEREKLHDEKLHADKISKFQEARDNFLRIQQQLEGQLEAQLKSSSELEQDKNVELTHAREAFAALESQLQQEMKSGQQAVSDLNRLQLEMQSSLDMMRNSLSWRLTSPLRKLASAIARSTSHTQEPINMSASGATDLREIDDSPSSIKNEKNNNNTHSLASEKKSEIENKKTHQKFKENSEKKPKNIPNMEITSANMNTQSNQTINLTIEDLLSFQDREFVYSAYQTLLLREPDADGLNYYLSRLRKGASKMEIIAQIFNSYERRATKQTIPQLEEALHRLKLSKLPIFGKIYIYFTGSEGFSSSDVKLRQVENQLYRYNEQLIHRFDSIDQKISLHKTILQDLNEKFDLNKKFQETSRQIPAKQTAIKDKIIPSLHVSEVFSELSKSITYKNF
ncbi:FkbM family methyltransferase [Comamonas antarctica]|uniref:FkbM family methyltransferase n=1 Tax=Comamonas antarctica TaxID=2743470 RepID=A0A6N1XAW0_9BURK|nr:FkbM family methyltransferase [Comamonas antarctica]QKV54846.1 FkbM family methyltransferase [Comamonas antarctica]